MTRYAKIQQEIIARPRRWLVTGVAGFIGSNLLEALLKLDQSVVGLDNFSTGHRRNLDEVRGLVTSAQWARFTLIEGDVRRLEDCQAACRGVDHVLHQAALGSVPRSLEDPIRSHASNVDGILNMLVAVRDARIPRLVYASSSAVFGDHPALPKVETAIGQPLSPYAATKLMAEIYAGVFARNYGVSSVGLRYFNVFGPRQDPAGAYAAVIPRWFHEMLGGLSIAINGDGETSRDFSHIDNVVQANLLAALVDLPAGPQVFNVACGERTTLRQLFAHIRDLVARDNPAAASLDPVYRLERAGDVRHSLADISAARTMLGYGPTVALPEGLARTFAWYRQAEAAAPRSTAGV